MKNYSLCLLFLILLVSGAQAQQAEPPALGGARFVSAAERVADSNAAFGIGLSLDGGASFTDTAALANPVRIVGLIRPEPEHIGQAADIFVVDRVNLVFMMQNQDGIFSNWNGRVPDLVPFREGVVLGESEQVVVFEGTLGAAGDHRFFLGYLPADGFLRYTPTPVRLTIVEENPVDPAFALFESSISQNVVTRCLECHVSGGLGPASGAQHVFLAPAASFLEDNFEEFRALKARVGTATILSKVTGGLAHGGSQVLTSGSQTYQDLQTFLNLL